MSFQKFKIPCVNTRDENAAQAIDHLRHQLTPQGGLVSQAGRQRTVEVFGEPLTPLQVVQRICADVQARGLAAVLDYSRRIDGVPLTATSLRVSPDELEQAHAAAEQRFLQGIRRIRNNIITFQQQLLPKDVQIDASDGSQLQQRHVPLDRVGICVPGGAAAYPSTLLMTAVPAQAAGVGQCVVVAPPTPLGAYNVDVLATCHELGITEVYRVGGAQAVAALAYGIDGMPQVDKIVGPGNLFVALAKRHVFGEVGIDTIAGPSEVVIVADETARADFTAADLIAQAEHAPGSSVLITWHEPLLEATRVELTKQLSQLERSDLARQSLEEFGALILVRDVNEAVTLANRFAPEHLQLATENADSILPRIRTAGAVFLGHHTPVAIGDYVAGPSHVLPTGGTARFASGLSVTDFIRAHSVIQLSPTDLERVSPDVVLMAQKEGLAGHAKSVQVRLSHGETS